MSELQQQVIMNLSVWAMICVAFLALVVVQSLLLVATASMGKRIYERLTRKYALHVVWYWLERLEKEGVRCFPKAGSAPQGKENKE